MNKQQQERWKSQKLELILKAFAAHAKLKNALVFKGVRIYVAVSGRRLCHE